MMALFGSIFIMVLFGSFCDDDLLQRIRTLALKTLCMFIGFIGIGQLLPPDLLTHIQPQPEEWTVIEIVLEIQPDPEEWPVTEILMTSIEEDPANDQLENEDLEESSSSLTFEDCDEKTEDLKNDTVPLLEVEQKPFSASTHPQMPPTRKRVRLVRDHLPSPCPLAAQPKEPPPKKTRITFIGHSYVRELANQNFQLVLGSQKITPEFIAVPGGTFRNCLNSPHYFKKLRNTEPDIVVAIIGGNDLKSEDGLVKNFEECSQFYKTLRNTVPSAYIIASQVETRWYSPNNKYGCPTHYIYDHIRRRFNRFLECQNSHNLILEIEGHLDTKRDYRDGIRLSHTGFQKYFHILQTTVSFAEEKRSQTHKQTSSDGPCMD